MRELDLQKDEMIFECPACGTITVYTDEEIPRYERDALIYDYGCSWGIRSVDLKTRMIHFDTEWWYDIFDSYVEEEMGLLIKSGLVEEI